MNTLSILLLIMAAREPVVKFDDSVHLFFEGNPYYYICVYLQSAILIAMAAQDKGYVLHIPGLRDVLLWVGERSYTLYVFHLLSLVLAQKLGELCGIGKEHWVRVGAIYLAVMVILIEVVFRFWEHPWRTKGRRIAANMLAHATSEK
jgi:peptidoglycan/LPS O-acetylase OafA/YrhL